MEETLKQYTDVFFLILSFYGEFEYVQKALRLGALDYILKSTVVGGNELLESLLSARAKIQQTREKAKKDARDIESLKTPEMKLKFFNAFIDNRITNEFEIKSGFEQLGLDYLSANYFLMGIRIKGYYKIQKQMTGTDDTADDLIGEMAGILEETLSEYGPKAILKMDENFYLIILDLIEKPELISAENKIISIAELIRVKIQAALGFGLHIFISKRIKAGQFADYCKKLDYANKYKIFMDDPQNIFPDEIVEKKSDKLEMETLNRKLSNLFDQKEKFFEFLYDLFFDVIAKSKNIRVYEGVCIDVISVYNKMLNNCLLYTSRQGDTLDLPYLPISQMYVFDQLEETYEWIKEKFELVYDITQKFKMPNYNSTVVKIIDYITGHYSETINLDILSKQVNFNKFYLCRIFKEETGYNITDYINHQRIKKAKEMLQDDAIKINMISDLVGYNDAAYFNKVFKKTVGVSPSEYKKQVGSELNKA